MQQNIQNIVSLFIHLYNNIYMNMQIHLNLILHQMCVDCCLYYSFSMAIAMHITFKCNTFHSIASISLASLSNFVIIYFQIMYACVCVSVCVLDIHRHINFICNILFAINIMHTKYMRCFLFIV